MKRHSREISVAGVLALLLVVLAIWAPRFYQVQPLLSLAARESPTLLVVCGVALVIIARQIDVSVGSQFAVCCVGAGLLAQAGWPIPLVAAGAVGLGAVMGFFNGTLVAVVGMPSIVVTLATMVIWREGLAWLRQGEFVNLPDDFQWLGLSQLQGQVFVVVSALVVVVALLWAMRRLAAGRWIHAVGSDLEAARLAGIPTRGVLVATFVVLGVLVGLAATLNVVQSPQVDPKSGTGLELKAIAAAVVGGISINGGRGNLTGAFLGLLLLACISPALTHLHVEAYLEKAIHGGIILLAVVGEGWRSRRNRP